jgi:integrase
VGAAEQKPNFAAPVLPGGISTMAIKLTDKKVNSVKVSGKTADGKPRRRQDFMDAVVPGFGVRVTDRGQRTYVLAGRFPGSTHYTRRELGKVGAMTLAEARVKARRWIELIGQGKDPAHEEEQLARENLRQQENTFAQAAADYIENDVIGLDPDRPRQRKAKDIQRIFECVLIPLWGGKPITAITIDDIEDVIERVKKSGTAATLVSFRVKPPPRPHKRGRPASRQGKPAPGQARNLLSTIKTFFNWVRRQKRYGLKSNPCTDLSAKHLIGPKMPVDRILDDAELAAFWRAAGRLRYPYGPFYKLLALTGLRLNELADASWDEFNGASWIIPKERMKSRNEKARAHAVPLIDDIRDVLDSLPRFKRGNFLFSTRFGEKPVWINDKVKKQLDTRMLRTLKALARLRGDDPDKVELKSWVNHDLRRTLRSGLSRLRVDRDTAEAVLAHTPLGIIGTYDVYDRFDEKKEALSRWGAHIRSLVEPSQADNVIPLVAR